VHREVQFNIKHAKALYFVALKFAGLPDHHIWTDYARAIFCVCAIMSFFAILYLRTFNNTYTFARKTKLLPISVTNVDTKEL
jgi:hypothetical protein